MTNNIMTEAQAVYEAAYTKEWYAKTGTSPIRIVQHTNMADDSSPVAKVYETEGNFFMCGFTWLEVKSVGAGKKLIALAREAGMRVSKGYPSGFIIHFKRLANSPNKYEGNGDHYIQVYAYSVAIDFLEKAGYPNIGLYQNLD